MNEINISRIGSSLIDEIMESEPTDKESAYAIAVQIASKMIIEMCFIRVHIDEIPAIIFALESIANSLKNILSQEESDELIEIYENLRSKMSVTTIIGDDDESL